MALLSFLAIFARILPPVVHYCKYSNILHFHLVWDQSMSESKKMDECHGMALWAFKFILTGEKCKQLCAPVSMMVLFWIPPQLSEMADTK